MDRLYFTSTRLKVQGKQGILIPDGDGYYEMPIGAFNCMNNCGEMYTSENIDNLFNESSDFMRKLRSGKLFGEWGHPEKHPSESVSEFMSRACNISDKHTCAFFKDIWIDKNVTPDMQKYGVPKDAWVAMAKVKPHGLAWESLDRSLKDPNVNTTFSGRFMTRDRMYRGQCYIVVEKIITYDAVTEQGIPAAEKYLAPRLESRNTQITPKMVDDMRRQLDTGKLRIESANQLQGIIHTADNFFREQRGETRGYYNW